MINFKGLCIKNTYRPWYYNNKTSFEQFLKLRQEGMTIDEYFEQFSWSQKACRLEDKQHYLLRFLRGMRPSILENMEDCKTKYEECEEAISVGHMLNRSCMEIYKPLAGKFQQSIKAHIVETVANEIKTLVEKPNKKFPRFNATLEQFAKQMQDIMAQMIDLQQEQKEQ